MAHRRVIISPPLSALQSDSCYDLCEAGPFSAKCLEKNDLVPTSGIANENV